MNLKKFKRYQRLMQEIADRKPKVILEIGTYDAGGAVNMCKTARKYLEKDDKLVYYGFDLFSDVTPEIRELEIHHKKLIPSKKSARKKIEQHADEVRLVQGNTNETLLDFQPEHEIDFIFIDGGHSFDTIANDWEQIKMHVGLGTVVIFDDYYDEEHPQHEEGGCQRLIDELSKDDKYIVEVLAEDGDKNKLGKVILS